MEYLNNFKRSISQELNQNDILQRNLLVSILSSRRLLSDHLDILEEAAVDCLKEYKSSNEKITLLKTTGILATSYAAFACIQSSYSYIIPCVSSTVPLLYICKQSNIQKRNSLENTLKDLIKAFDEFETGVKKTISFINDAQVMEVYAKVLKRYDRKNLIPFHLVDTIKRVVRAVYCFTKYMEYYYKLDAKLSYLYPEIDDVDNCDLIRMYKEEWEIKTIKDFYSLFAYVQSYALLRLGLIVASNIDEGVLLLKMKVNDMTNKIKVQTTRIPSFLEVAHNMKRFHDDVQQQLDSEASKATPKELRMISSDALDVSINALSFAINTFELHNVIKDFAKNHQKTSKKSVDDMLSRLEGMGTQIYGCSDEVGRLTIAVKKYLKKEDENVAEKLPEIVSPKEILKIIKADDVEPQKDDFFYVNPSSIEHDDEESKTEELIDAEEDLQVRLTKKCFKPVLMQLKQRIVPIGEDFKEREKRVLKEKGIEVAEEALADFKKESSESGSDDEQDRERKFARSRSKFDESRELLMSKNPFNIFQPTIPLPCNGKLIGMDEENFE